MIEVTRLGGKTLLVNAELIETVEATPDTVLTLTTGRKLVVSESPEVVAERCLEYRRRQRWVFVPDLRQMREIEERIRRVLSEGDLEGAVETRIEERGLVVRLAGRILFDSGEATLRPDGREALDRLAGVLAGLPNHLRVEAHTDERPINTDRFPSSWELSTARAAAIVRYLITEHGIAPGRLSAAGCGAYRPVASSAAAEERQLNGRVDIVILFLGASRWEPVRGGEF